MGASVTSGTSAAYESSKGVNYIHMCRKGEREGEWRREREKKKHA